MRLTQAPFTPDEVRLMSYVDDPPCGLRGNGGDRRMFVVILILVWAALGFQLAFVKSQLGHTVTELDGTLCIEARGVRASVERPAWTIASASSDCSDC